MAHLVQFIDVEMSPEETAAYLDRRSRGVGLADGRDGGRHELALVIRRSAAEPSLAEIRLEPRPGGGTRIVYRELELGVVGLWIALTAFSAARLRDAIPFWFGGPPRSVLSRAARDDT